ncbi:MAG TPA: restriction endonuclease subunit S [Gallionella sp.]|nr:restriction endonuclease subunit S [Gallionella sp.]
MSEPLSVREAPASYVLDALRVRKGYKQTEVGVIPEDWDVKTLGMSCDIITKGTTPTSIGRAFVKTGIKFLKAETISDSGKTIPEKVAYIDDVTHALLKRSQLSSGDLLISIAGVLGRVGLVERTDLPANTNQALAIVRLGKNTEIVRNFIFYCLRSPVIAKQISDINVQAAQANISLQNVKDFLLPLPPTKAEQEAIAEALNDADALIEALEQLIAKKRHLKQGAMQELLTGKKRLPGFGGEWEVRPLGELFNFSGGYSASREQLSSEGYCYLHYGDIHGSNKTYIDVRAEIQDIPKLDIPLKKVSSVSLLNDGDVVFVDASEDDEGTSKHVVIVNPDKTPYISGLHTIVAKKKVDEFDHRYLRYCFQTTEVKAQFKFFAVGTKVSGISKTNIAKVLLPLPSVPEQTAIATILSDMDADLAALEQQLAKARNIKQGMMQELLTGRVRLV